MRIMHVRARTCVFIRERGYILFSLFVYTHTRDDVCFARELPGKNKQQQQRAGDVCDTRLIYGR